MSIISNDNTVKVDIGRSLGGNFIEKRVINCVKRIISDVRQKYGTDYEDNTYRQLYIECQQFSKTLGDILAAENINQINPNPADISNTTKFFS